jgi:ubiquinone/menaquinone biosynthesis C-methylase UbiE
VEFIPKITDNIFMGEKELSRSLKTQTNKYLNQMGIETKATLFAGGVAIDFPYSEVGTALWNQQVSNEAWKNFEALSLLFNPETLPEKWVGFIKEVDKERKKNGSGGPVDLLHGMFFFTQENPLAREANLPKFERYESGEIDFHDGEKIKALIDKVLDDPKLRKEYKHMLTKLIPDVSMGIDKDCVKKVMQKLDIKNGIALDLGCGTGEETKDWSEKLGMFTLGVDRQYHCQWYDPYWKNKDKEKNTAFVMGDFNRGIPIKNESVDVAFFQYVAHHVTQKSMKNGLKESLRVLKKDGWIFVGPQQYKNGSEWRFFKKEAKEDGKEFEFKEYGYYDLCPEEKPQP